MGGGSKLCHNAHIDGTDGVQAVPVNAAIDPSTVAQDKDIYVTCDSWCVCSPAVMLHFPGYGPHAVPLHGPLFEIILVTCASCGGQTHEDQSFLFGQIMHWRQRMLLRSRCYLLRRNLFPRVVTPMLVHIHQA